MRFLPVQLPEFGEKNIALLEFRNLIFDQFKEIKHYFIFQFKIERVFSFK